MRRGRADADGGPPTRFDWCYLTRLLWRRLTCSPLPSAARALAQPVREVGPDLMLGLRSGHQADVSARAVPMRDVLARDEIEQRHGAVRRGDVVSARGHHEQVLLDPRQLDAFVAQTQAAGDEPVLLVHPCDPFAVG